MQFDGRTAKLCRMHRDLKYSKQCPALTLVPGTPELLVLFLCFPENFAVPKDVHTQSTSQYT